MKNKILTAVALFSMALAAARADNVTVHGTVGLLEAQLVTKELAQVGIVEVWNTKLDMNLVVTPASGLLLSKVYIYMDTEPLPPPVPEAYVDLVSDYAALLADCAAFFEEALGLPDWLVESQEYLMASESPEDVNESFEDLLKAYSALVEKYAVLVEGFAALATDSEVILPEGYTELLAACQTSLGCYQDALVVYKASLAYPDFGAWPYGDVFKKPTSDGYKLKVPLGDLKNLQWGQWGEPWLQKRLLTIAVRVELKTTDKVPVTFTASAINPNVLLAQQETRWSDNQYAFRYELQHPKHGQFMPGPVNGLAYRTWTHQGTTGVDGGFWFYPGEYVRFSIGSVDLGYAKADTRVTPLDIFASSEPSDPPVLNMMRLLMGLDTDLESNGSIQITDASVAALASAMGSLGLAEIDFANNEQVEGLLSALQINVSDDDALVLLEQAAGSLVMRRNVSKSPEYAVDKPKLDIMPVWVPARTANGLPATIDYKDDDGNIIETRNKAKPLFVTYTEVQEPNTAAGIIRSGSDIITAVSMDDGATWKRFNVSHMARHSSFTLETGEKFPGNCIGPQQKIAEDKILVVWTSAYARGGKPSFSIKTDDDYPYDDAYAVNDIWGVRGRQGSVDYNEDKDVGDQGIGEIPYYALWAARGVLVWNEDLVAKFPGSQIGDVVWFKPERITSGRRDAFFPMAGSAKNVGFAIAWQEDPGGLLPGSCKGGGDGWSGATVHKKTDIWYSFISYADFDLIDEHWDPAAMASADELGDAPDEHGQQPEFSNRPKWRVPMSLPLRVSDNSVVNTENLKLELDPVTGLPVIDPVTGSYIPLDGALEADWLATEHEGEGGCEDGDGDDGSTGGHNGRGGGWGLARYAYELPELGILNWSLPSSAPIWDEEVEGDYRPNPGYRWTRFVNKAGAVKTVAVTTDGRPLDGDTGACRPALTVMPGGWVILGYEETKGLGIPPEGEHGEETDVTRPEPDDKGKNIIYHSFRFDQPDRVSAGHVLNLPALNDNGELIPIFYKDATGLPTVHFRQYKTENARRIRFIAQPKEWLTKYKAVERTSVVAVYRQGREGSGKPSDVFAIRGVVPLADMSNKSANPYKWENLQRYGSVDAPVADTSDPGVIRGWRRHMNMSAATVEAMDPVEKAGDGEGNSWNKVGKWKQYQGNLSDESFANPYSDAKAHRGFLRGDLFVFGYSFTPNWGRLGGDHMDFFVRRSFNGGRTFTTDPNGPEVTIHTVIERDPETGEFSEKQYQYGRGEFEPGRNVSVLKGNKYTVTDPRLVPPMGPGTVNPTYPEDDTEQDPRDPGTFTYYVAFGTAEVLHGLGEPLGVTDTIKDDIFYSRTTDGGSTWLMVPWVINPNSASPDAGETVYRWPWLAQGTPHQGHAQIRMHPGGTRLYAIWHQWTDGDEMHVSPHDVGNDIWFRRIDFMQGQATQ